MHNLFRKKIVRVSIFVVSIFLLTGCSLLNSSNNTSPDGGIFRSIDSTDTWEHKVLIPTVDERVSHIAQVNVLKIEPDPQDRYALYIATRENGMYYTYTAANAWVKAPVAEQSAVLDIAVDPQNKCRVYIATGNQVFISTDCSRTWNGTYIQNDINDVITAIDINSTNTAVLYSGDIRGNVFKSFDYGLSWSNIARFNSAIKELIVDPNDGSIIYIATENNGIMKSNDSGATFFDVTPSLDDFRGAETYNRLILIPSNINSLLYASSYGILKTGDGGDTWEMVPLLTKPGTIKIFALGINPLNDNDIYYATESTFFRTIDGGENWITDILPTSRVPTSLYIDPVEPSIIYLGAAARK